MLGKLNVELNNNSLTSVGRVIVAMKQTGLCQNTVASRSGLMVEGDWTQLPAGAINFERLFDAIRSIPAVEGVNYEIRGY